MLAVARRGCPSVICLKKGHRANCALLSGIFNEERLIPITIHTGVVNIQEVLPSVVLVCVWDPDAKQVKVRCESREPFANDDFCV